MSLGLNLNLGLGTATDRYPRCWLPVFGIVPGCSIDIPLWTSGNGTGVIEFEVNFAEDNGNRYQLCMSHSGGSQGWFGLERSKFRWDTRYDEVYIDGVLATNNGVSVVYGQSYLIKLVDTSAAIGIGEFGSGWTGGGADTWYMTGGMRNIYLTDTADPTLNRHYPGILKQVARPTTTNYPEQNGNDGTLERFPASGAWEATTCSPLTVNSYAPAYTEEYD